MAQISPSDCFLSAGDYNPCTCAPTRCSSYRWDNVSSGIISFYNVILDAHISCRPRRGVASLSCAITLTGWTSYKWPWSGHTFLPPSDVCGCFHRLSYIIHGLWKVTEHSFLICEATRANRTETHREQTSVIHYVHQTHRRAFKHKKSSVHRARAKNPARKAAAREASRPAAYPPRTPACCTKMAAMASSIMTCAARDELRGCRRARAAWVQRLTAPCERLTV